MWKFSPGPIMKFTIFTIATTLLAAIVYQLTSPDVQDNFMPELTYDYIIVGGGTAGCLLANRLSTDTSKRVLVIEAGDYPRGWTRLLSSIPIAVPFLLGSRVDWHYWTTSQDGIMKALKQNQFPLPAGRVFGGTSAINAMIYAPGLDGDFNFHDGWTNNQRFYSKTICEDETSSSCLRLEEVDALPELTRAFLQTGKSAGQDQGFVKATAAVHHGMRHTAFDAFIVPILDRTNFYRLTKTKANNVLLRDESGLLSAFGVNAITENGLTYQIRLKNGGEIILSAGAMATPKILLASGIGRKDVLTRLNITQKSDLPVGENVQDHPFLGIYFSINETFSLTTRKLASPLTFLEYLLHGTGPLSHAGGTIGLGYLTVNGTKPEVVSYSSRRQRDVELIGFGVGSIINDLIKQASNFDDESWDIFKPPNYDKSQEGFLVNVVLLRPQSRGRVVLDDLNKDASVDVRYLSDTRDLQKLVKAVQFTIEIIESNPLFRAMGAEAHLPVYRECRNLEPRSREAIECLIRHVAIGMYHVTSSCSMGTDMRSSVVDLKARVHGINSLRIADASVLPNVPSAHPMATILMVAERIADLILNETG